MDIDDVLDELVARELVEEIDGGVRLTDGFAEKLETSQADNRDREVEYRLDDFDSLAEVPEAVRETVAHDDDLFAIYSVVSETFDEMLPGVMLRLTAAVDHLQRPPARTDGSPQGFLPVRGDRLRLFTALYPRSVVYVWREDCDPCDLMKETFDDLYEEALDDVALLSVYGPEWSRTLREEYDVVGGPTTLFVIDGEVDSRIHGSHYESVITSEVEKLRSLG